MPRKPKRNATLFRDAAPIPELIASRVFNGRRNTGTRQNIGWGRDESGSWGGDIRLDRWYLYPLMRRCQHRALFFIVLHVISESLSAPGSPEEAESSMRELESLTGQSTRAVELALAEGEQKTFLSRRRDVEG